MTGELYIGRTTGTIEKRFKKHQCRSDNFALRKDMYDYGKDNFSVEEIDRAFSKEELVNQEYKWTKYYMEKHKCYNIKIGDKQSLATRQKLSEKNRGDKSGRARKIKCITTGEIFTCISYACDKYGTTTANIGSCLNGRRKSAGKLPDGTKLFWQYAA